MPSFGLPSFGLPAVGLPAAGLVTTWPAVACKGCAASGRMTPRISVSCT
ncbi:MAG: hypothetical protein KDA51_13875 [Planctomycetales bacterium]|nr:hypothetical protein [Planctomycetales bacterium]